MFYVKNHIFLKHIAVLQIIVVYPANHLEKLTKLL